MYDCQIHIMFHLKWISNLQDLPWSQNLETGPSLHCLAVFATWQYCLYSQVWWINEINRFRRLSQALVHFVMERASLFTDHGISGLPIRAKYEHFRTILRACIWQFPNRFCFFFFEVVVIGAWSRYFLELLSRLVCQHTISLHIFSSHDLPYYKTMKTYEKFSEYGSFSVLTAKIRDSNMVL